RIGKKTGQASIETRFYITSLTADPAAILAATRAHWSIENNLHWQLDITFDEDRCRSREDFSPLNLAIVRHAVLDILERDGSKMSLKRKRVRAAVNSAFRAEILGCQRFSILPRVDTEITRLGIEHDVHGNRAKAFLYCLETRCPKIGWMVPMAPSWVISKTRNVVAKLFPDPEIKRYRIEIHSGVSAVEMAEAEKGMVRDGRLIHPMNPECAEQKTRRPPHKAQPARLEMPRTKPPKPIRQSFDTG
ncbi:MAG: ISAs1 family transposase, partial [Beijerinckiaceae bacterium]